jgi:hypothetical protein
MKNERTLRAELQRLEGFAASMEIVILRELKALEVYSQTTEVLGPEARIWSKAEKLDDLQTEIDGVIAELKANGWYKPADYSGAVYEYRPPKVKQPKAETPVKERKPRKVYPVAAPKAAPKRKRRTDRELAEALRLKEAQKAATAAEKQQLKAERREAREALKKPRSVRAPKPRKPKESRELMLAKKRRDSIQERLSKLDAQIDAERVDLERRLEERKARVLEVANQSTADKGPQNRRNAKLALENVESQLRDLPKRKEERLNSLTEQLENALKDINRLAESHSQ